MKQATRYRAEWYQKRINQNAKIKQHLLNIIHAHAEADFPFDISELNYLNYEDLLEIAVAAVNKDVAITLGEGSDLSNGADCKFSIVRAHNRGRGYTAGIKCKHKDFVYACVYENIQDKFYYFAFPTIISEHSIPFDPNTGQPKRQTKMGENHMWTWECATFEEMAMAATGQSHRPAVCPTQFDILFA